VAALLLGTRKGFPYIWVDYLSYFLNPLYFHFSIKLSVSFQSAKLIRIFNFPCFVRDGLKPFPTWVGGFESYFLSNESNDRR